MTSRKKKTLSKLSAIFSIIFIVLGFLAAFYPAATFAAEGGCVCNDSATCPSQTLSGATMTAARNHCSTYCTTDCSGGGVSSFTAYWPCLCCDGTDLGTRSDSGCRTNCTSHGGTGLSGDPSTVTVSDCPGRFTSAPTSDTGVTRSPGCYCSGTLARAMACSSYTDCVSSCPSGTSPTDIACVSGYSSSSSSGTSGAGTGETTAEANPICWRQSQCLNSCPVDGGCDWENPSSYPPCNDGSGNFGRCIPKNAQPVTLQVPFMGVTQITNIADYIALIYKYMVSIGGILAGIMIMVGGLIYLTAGGSAERVGSAKSYIGNALIGLVLLLTSYVILQTINPELVQFSRFTVPLIRPALIPARFCDEIPAPAAGQAPLKFARATVAGTSNLRPLSEVSDADFNLDTTKFSEMRCGTPFYEISSGSDTCLGRSCDYTSSPGAGHPGACIPTTDDEKNWDCKDVAFAGTIKNYQSFVQDIVLINRGLTIGPCPYVVDVNQKIWPDFYYVPRQDIGLATGCSAGEGFALSFGENPGTLESVIRGILGFLTGSIPNYQWRVATSDLCLGFRSSALNDQLTGEGNLGFSPNDLTTNDANFHGPVICNVDINTLQEPSHSLFH